MKFFKKVMSLTLSAAMIMSSFSFHVVTVQAAPSVASGWYEALYAEWADSDPDAASVSVGYKLSADEDYTYLKGDDLTYLVRKASADGYGRVDIPGLKAGRYDIKITGSDGTVHERKGIQVQSFDRSGYAHWNYGGKGVGAYKDDGTPKDDAIIVYVTNENKNTVSVPGYEDLTISYSSTKSGNSWTKSSNGIGNILNNNHKLMRKITGPKTATITGFGSAEVNCDEHPVIFRFIGEVEPPENLTPYDAKTDELGGSEGDNGNLAITKYAKNVTIEGIGEDTVINGWGFTFSQTSTCPADAGEGFEVRNLTFKNYPEDALGFQGDDPIESPIRRVWVHNNVFYPGYCAKPAESDKDKGDGSLDFKRGQYYTMSYNHYVGCHKTNLLGAGDSNNQFYMTLHHNWYEDVDSRQPLASGGNVHIYNTYFSDSMTKNGKEHTTSKVIDLRGHAAAFSEANYFENTKNPYYSRKATANIKTYGDVLTGNVQYGSISGKMTVAKTRDESGLPDNELTFPNGDKLTDWDTNPTHFYYDAANKASDVEVLLKAEEVPEYVKLYAGTLKEFPLEESGDVVITVLDAATKQKITDASVTASGLKFKNNGDGTYTAQAQLGAEYDVKVLKDGYETQNIKTTVLENDGDIFQSSVEMPVDLDGYAAVKLTGGTSNAAVKGASIKLENDTVLEDKGDGTYVSSAQIATGTYKAAITNTGDYKAPATVDVVVKTTDEPTEIHLDKEQGVVTVTLAAQSGETETLNTSKAAVYVGNSMLKSIGNNTFRGEVDVNEPMGVIVNVPGWNTVSVTPETVTAAKGSTVTVNALLSYKGQTYTWNYTDGTNTDDFFSFSSVSDWSSANKNPQTYDGESLTKAIKVKSDLTVTFDAPTDGTLVLIMEASSGGSVYLNNVSYDIHTGENFIPVTAGENTLKKNKNETHLYLLQFIGQNEPEEDKLSDEIMWDIGSDLTESSNGLTPNAKFGSNTEEGGPVEFVEGDKTYELEDFLQGSENPKNAAGVNPQSAATDDHVPVTGAFIKFVPEKNGVFTAAVKTGDGKISYVTDGEGNVLNMIDRTDLKKSYDVIRTDVKAGKTYYLYSGGSNICIYYLGFTWDGTESDPDPDPQPDPDPDPDPQPVDKTKLGDVDEDGEIAIEDAALTFQYVLNPAAVKISEQGLKNMQVTNDGIDSSTAAAIFQKVLVSTFKFEVES